MKQDRVIVVSNETTLLPFLLEQAFGLDIVMHRIWSRPMMRYTQ